MEEPDADADADGAEARPIHYTRWPIVEGYVARPSVVAGETIELHTASRAERFSVEVTRVGAERRPVWSAADVAGHDHPVPDRAWADGCDWPVACSIPTGPTWPSGFYELTLRAEPDGRSAGGADRDPARRRSEAFVVLRPAATVAPGDLLLVLSTNTWNAYNQWGGRGLYRGADRVSFARPLERGYLRRPSAPHEVAFDGRITDIEDPPDPEHRRLVDYQRTGAWPLLTASSGWHNWERRFVRWAEAAGYRVDVATNRDLETDPDLLDRYRLVASVGHDEYWSWGMRDTMDRWVAAGGNWAILSGNTSFWQVRYEDDGRTMVCHKGRARIDDPVRGRADHLLTSMWSDPRIGRPETATTGLTFSRGGYHRIGGAVTGGPGGYTIHRPDHWLFAGTGLAEGDVLGAGSVVVGYEVDGCALRWTPGESGGAPRPAPTGVDGAPADLEILATAPARLISITDEVCEAPTAIWATVDPPGDLEGVAMILHDTPNPTAEQLAELGAGHAVLGTFTRGAGTVVNVGSADWAYGLDDDPAVQRVTANLIERLLGR
ncbi:MAG: N,N-dimethylformamidase beta subunit family domain-containing protein [Actinomycetota bacterium]